MLPPSDGHSYETDRLYRCHGAGWCGTRQPCAHPPGFCTPATVVVLRGVGVRSAAGFKRPSAGTAARPGRGPDDSWVHVGRSDRRGFSVSSPGSLMSAISSAPASMSCWTRRCGVADRTAGRAAPSWPCRRSHQRWNEDQPDYEWASAHRRRAAKHSCRGPPTRLRPCPLRSRAATCTARGIRGTAGRLHGSARTDQPGGHGWRERKPGCLSESGGAGEFEQVGERELAGR